MESYRSYGRTRPATSSPLRDTHAHEVPNLQPALTQVWMDILRVSKQPTETAKQRRSEGQKWREREAVWQDPPKTKRYVSPVTTQFECLVNGEWCKQRTTGKKFRPAKKKKKKETCTWDWVIRSGLGYIGYRVWRNWETVR